MKSYLGIDLGSTTSKAVLLDEHEHVIGRGITNTRANYDVAVEVARREALADALLSRVLGPLGERGAEAARAFRFEGDLHRLRQLRQTCRSIASAIPGDGARLVPEMDTLLARVVDVADELFGGGARDRGAFFRDLVGARFYAALDEACARGQLDFDRLSGIYDRAILQVENQLDEVPFIDALEAALRRTPSIDAAEREATLRVGIDAVRHPPEIAAMVGTGYGRARLPFAKDCIRSEILCHGMGAHAMFPATRTVLDIGGQDTKAIQVDAAGLVTGFQMNDRCAAGCGRYLGYIADELNLALQELGPLALTADKPCRITSTCTVFAGIELRDLLAVGEKRENVLAGLHRAIVTRAMSLLARSGGVNDQLTFTGGVAKNPACTGALTELVSRHYGPRTINISADSIYTGALGGALFARRDLRVPDVTEPTKECATCID